MHQQDTNHAGMMKSVDIAGLKPAAARRVGSSPSTRTKIST